MNLKKYFKYLPIVFLFVSFPVIAEETEHPREDLLISLKFQQFDSSVLGVELSYLLPFTNNFKLNFGYSTNSIFNFGNKAISANYYNFSAEYNIPVNNIFEPYLRAGILVSQPNFNIDKYPELKPLNSGYYAFSLNIGNNFNLFDKFSLFGEISANVPAYYTIPFFSWGLGGRYRF